MSAEGKEGKTCGCDVTCGVLLCGVHGKCAWYVIMTVCHVVKRVCMRCDMLYAMWFPYADMNHYM